jgi:hypothetical protein
MLVVAFILSPGRQQVQIARSGMSQLPGTNLPAGLFAEVNVR